MYCSFKREGYFQCIYIYIYITFSKNVTNIVYCLYISEQNVILLQAY